MAPPSARQSASPTRSRFSSPLSPSTRVSPPLRMPGRRTSAPATNGWCASACAETCEARGTTGLALRAQIVLSSVSVVGVLLAYTHGVRALGVAISIAASATGVYSLWLVRGSLGVPLGAVVRRLALPVGAA